MGCKFKEVDMKNFVILIKFYMILQCNVTLKDFAVQCHYENQNSASTLKFSSHSDHFLISVNEKSFEIMNLKYSLNHTIFKFCLKVQVSSQFHLLKFKLHQAFCPNIWFYVKILIWQFYLFRNQIWFSDKYSISH